MKEKAKLTATKNYGLFRVSEDNRAIDPSKHSKLKASMQLYGWLPAYPMHCVRKNGCLWIKDGQHRFCFAKELGLSVWYVVSDDDADIAVINQSQKTWGAADYANRWAKQGSQDYAELIQWASDNHIAIAVAAGLLYGNAGASNVLKIFHGGHFRIKDRNYANKCARIFNALREANSESARNISLLAIAACVRVPDFDVDRMVKTLRRRSDLLRCFGSRDAYLEAFESIYNDGYKTGSRTPLKFLAIEAMNNRNQIKARH